MTSTPEQLAREMEEALNYARKALVDGPYDAQDEKQCKALLALHERCEKAEKVCEAAWKHFTPEYAGNNWQFRNDTRAAVMAWKQAREGK